MINTYPQSKLCVNCRYGVELKDSTNPLVYKCLEGHKVNSKKCTTIFSYSELECSTDCDNCKHMNCE